MRRLFAKYGSDSGIDPRICWPSQQELESTTEDEQFYEPTFQQMLSHLKKEQENEMKFNIKLREKVTKGMDKMDSLLQAREEKIQGEIQKAEEAELKRKSFLQDAEEYYGYPVKDKSLEFKNFMEMKREEMALAKKLAKKAKQKK